jgi:rhamnogalacturonyl hydrolase YesR
MSLMAWAEYLYTGDRSFVEKHYDRLVAKLLLPLAGPDGLLKAPVKRGVGVKTLDKAFLESIGMANNRSFRILVDWPTTERDGHVLKQVNSVVNAFHYNNLLLMSRIAQDLDKSEDALRFKDEATRVAKAYQKAFFKEAEGIYRDGVGTDHSSIHANLFPLAFGLVPAEHQKSVADYVVSRGMSCSVYAAQYLMEALYRTGRANEAFDLLTSQDIRSWYNMIRVGSTITLEAWDNKFKPNQDWNHAWGAVPANIIPRYLLGVRPLEPGFGKVLVRPMPGPLQQVEATVPTPRGGMDLKINNEPGSPFELTLSIPANMTARVEIPLPAGQGELLMNGKTVKSTKRNGFAVIDNVVSGTHRFRTTAVVNSIEQGDGEPGVAPTAGTTTAQEFSSEQVLKTLELANSYFSKKYPDVEVIQGGHELKHKRFPSSYWGGAVYYTGLMALYSVDPKEEYYQQAVAFGEANQWKLNSYRVGKLNSFSHNANDHCAGGTYVDLYQIDPKPERIAAIRNCIKRLMETPVEPAKNAYPNWFWVDALYMAMPTFAKLGVTEQDDAYFDRMHEFYLSAKNEIGGGLYNAEDGLWWRDADFVAPYKEPNGEDCYWSRGNGWVYAALTQVLSVLPEDNQYRPEYLSVFKEMSAALLKVQRADGFWNVSLHDPSNFGGKELSGTSMFVYGFGWGVNNGVLDEKTYAPAMQKAWLGMAECVHPNGFLGYVQGSGSEPKSSQPVHYDRVPDLEDYGLGCFLLAGSELFKWKSGKSTNKRQDQ